MDSNHDKENQNPLGRGRRPNGVSGRFVHKMHNSKGLLLIFGPTG